MTITAGNVDYTFDYAVRHQGKAVFAKIFHEGELSVGKKEFGILEKAIMACHLYYDSQIYLFPKDGFPTIWCMRPAMAL